MAMLWRGVAACALAAGVGCVWTASAQAGDVFWLGLNTEAPTLNLVGGQEADTLPVQWRGGGYGGYRGGYGGYGGYRGYYGGYRGGYGGYGGYYGGYRGGYGSYGGYYPRYYGGSYGGYGGYSSRSYGGYRGGYGGYGGYYPRSYGGYYGGSRSYYGISYVSPLGCPPRGQDIPGIVLSPGGSGAGDTDTPPGSQPLNPMKPVPQDGTFPYDGGPADPVPMPKVEPAPAGKVRPHTMPLEGRPVSVPPPTTKKYEYLAYGETPAAQPAPEVPKDRVARDRIVVLKAEPAKKAPR
jgi:hypothetical protein